MVARRRNTIALGAFGAGLVNAVVIGMCTHYAIFPFIVQVLFGAAGGAVICIYNLNHIAAALLYGILSIISSFFGAFGLLLFFGWLMQTVVGALVSMWNTSRKA